MKRVTLGTNQQGAKPMPRPQATEELVAARVTGFVPSEKQEVVVEAPKSKFQNDGRYVLLGAVPSLYKFYTFKELWIRPFTVNEAKLVYMARKSKNMMYLKAAVGACINEDVNDLVSVDFEFCLYWLRLNSYPKKPFNVKWVCDNLVSPDTGLPLTDDEKTAIVEDYNVRVLEHNEKLGEGEEPIEEMTVEDFDFTDYTVECEHENLSQITKTNLTVGYFPEDVEVPSELTLPTMTIFDSTWALNKKLKDLKEKIAGSIDEDVIAELEAQEAELEGDVFESDLAQWLRRGNTLEDKLKVLHNQNDLSLQDTIEEFTEKLKEFGISEFISVKCAKCGGVLRRRLSIDYLSFFP